MRNAIRIKENTWVKKYNETVMTKAATRNICMELMNRSCKLQVDKCDFKLNSKSKMLLRTWTPKCLLT